MAKTDTQLKRDIEEELRSDSQVNTAPIGVSVEQGVVSRLGSVDSYTEKWATEGVTRRVHGVRTVALTVKLRGELTRTDVALAAVPSALNENVSIPDTVTALEQGADQVRLPPSL